MLEHNVARTIWFYNISNKDAIPSVSNNSEQNVAKTVDQSFSKNIVSRTIGFETSKRDVAKTNGVGMIVLGNVVKPVDIATIFGGGDVAATSTSRRFEAVAPPSH